MTLWIPIVLFIADTFEPRIQSVVHHKAVSQLFMIVTEVTGQTERDRTQPGTLRSEVDGLQLNLFCLDKQKFRCVIDESSDQPRTGDSINLWTFTSDPLYWRCSAS